MFYVVFEIYLGYKFEVGNFLDSYYVFRIVKFLCYGFFKVDYF